MSFEITQKARNLKDQINKTPQLILEIDGIPLRFGTADILRFPTFDENPLLEFDDNLFFDTAIIDDNGRAYISLKDGTSGRVFSQLIPEKGGAGSVQSFKIALLNKNRELTPYFTSGNNVPDIMGRDARIYLGFKGGTFPDDFITIFDGFINDFGAAHNLFVVSVSIPTQRVRAKIFNVITTSITAQIDDIAVNIPALATGNFIIPTIEQEENIKSYIKIDKEIIKLTQTNTPTEFQNVLRSQLGSVAIAHDTFAEVTSFIRLQGNPIDLALKLLLSSPRDEFYIDGDEIDRFVKLNDSETIRNSIYFNFDIKAAYNVIEGDIVTVIGASEAANNFAGRLISEIEITSNGSYIVVTGNALTSEVDTSATVQIKSQYNVLPNLAGVGMKPKYVDLDGIAELATLLGASLSEIDIYVTDEITAKEWIEKEIFKVSGLFYLKRKGRYSISAALPPINSGETVFINETNITNIETLVIKRSVNKNHYNAIVYKFQKDAVDGTFKAGVIIFSQQSINRIPVGNKQLTMEASGLRDDVGTRTAINRQAQRLIDKYQFAPQYIEGINVNFKTGYTIEAGDSVIFGGEGVKIPNTETGDDFFPETLMEVISADLNIKTGATTLSLINSAFGLNGRFSVISPSSYIESSGLNFLVLKRSFATTILQTETEKWEEFIGKKVRIRDVNFTKEQILTVASIGVDVENKLIFEENISIVINEDDLLDLPDYDDAEDYHKLSYAFLGPQIVVDAVTSTLIIEADPTNLFEGSIVLVRNELFTEESQEVFIDDITGNVITFSEPLNYLPIAGDFIELTGFVDDQGLPYRYL